MKATKRAASQKFLSMAGAGIVACLTPLHAQTATTQPQTVTTTAPSIPAGTTLCTVPRNGGACKTPTAIVLPKVSVTIPGQTTAVNLSGFTGSFSCSPGPDSTVITAPDGTQTITGLVCSITKP